MAKFPFAKRTFYHDKLSVRKTAILLWKKVRLGSGHFTMISCPFGKQHFAMEKCPFPKRTLYRGKLSVWKAEILLRQTICFINGNFTVANCRETDILQTEMVNLRFKKRTFYHDKLSVW